MLTALQIIREQLAAESVVDPARADLPGAAISFSLSYCKPTDNPALVVDVTGPLGVGRMTWWADGSLSAEAIRYEDGASLLMKSMDAPLADQAIAALKEIAAALHE